MVKMCPNMPDAKEKLPTNGAKVRKQDLKIH